MAFGRLTRPQGQRLFSDINMTPLIDVMLVLLVIFIITAPLLTGSLKLDLPKVEAPAAQQVPTVLDVGLRKDGQLYLGDKAITLVQLKARFAEAARIARPLGKAAAFRDTSARTPSSGNPSPARRRDGC